MRVYWNANKQNPSKIGLDNHEESLSVWLDMFRWMAAFAVLISHVRHRVFIPITDMPPGSKSAVFYLVGGVSSFGPPAVIIFFVLSGFLVGGSSLRRFRSSGTFSSLDYIIARLSRLWIVLIPTFCLTYMLNRLGADIFGSELLATFDIGPPVFLCNTAFLQTAFCGQYGGNGALWSLFNEFWYYVAWPMVMFALFSNRSLIERAILLALPIIILSILAWNQFVGPNIAIYFSIWLLGVWAADRARPPVSMPIWLSTTLFVLSLLAWRLVAKGEVQGGNLLHDFPIDLLIGLTFANMILTMKSATHLPYPPWRTIHKPFAGFSFTLYCVHTPVINCFVAFLVWQIGTGKAMLPIGYLPYTLFALATCLCLAIAYFMSLITERHTLRVRRFIHAKTLRPSVI